MNKKIIACAILSVVIAALVLPSVANASINKPQWEKGDYWKYKTKIYMGSIGADNIASSEKVIGKGNVTVNGTAYNVTIVRVTPNRNYSIENTYYRSSDFAVVKLEFIGTNNTVIYDPPYVRWKFPIEIGDTWEYKGNITRFSSGNSEKSYLELIYNCTGEANISVPAGEFHCYVIKESSTDGRNHAIHYLSPDVGNEVEVDTYYNNQLSSKKVLLSFSYMGNTVNGTEDNNATSNASGGSKTPGFGIISLMFGMAVAIFSIRRSSRKL